MAQISLFAAGYVLMTLGGLIALLRGGKAPTRPHPSAVAGLLVTVAGLAATIAGAAVG
jgi:hypothetical protein